jgi:hypothetical protein
MVEMEKANTSGQGDGRRGQVGGGVRGGRSREQARSQIISTRPWDASSGESIPEKKEPSMPASILIAECPMLCMTAFFEDFDVDRARRCSFLTVIPKPISADTFVVQIEYYLPAEKRMVLRPLQP